MPRLIYNGSLKPFSRQLRSNMTEAEKLLWSRIRRKQLKERQFFRQRIIGRYIVDFYCPRDKLVVELDGGQHYTDEGKKKDQARDDFLKSKGLKVLRFSDREVFDNLEGVLEVIYRHMKAP
jgi:very-short-patch-repair endonuclease